MKQVFNKRIFPVLLALTLLFAGLSSLHIEGYAVDAASAAVLQAGLWECNSAIMTGDYLDLSEWPSGLGAVPLSFISSGSSYDSISMKYDIYSSKGQCIYYGSTLAYSYADSDWTQDVFAMILLSTSQEVPQEFYDWFTDNFTYVGSSETMPAYSTVINVYSSDGLTLLASYSATENIFAPYVTGVVLDSGLDIMDPTGQILWTWEHTGDFYGFSMNPKSTLVAYDSGDTFYCGGYAADFTLSLYLVTSPPSVFDDPEFKSGILGALDGILNILQPSESQKFLGIIDFYSIGLFFTSAYNAFLSFFGLGDLLNSPNGPFNWITEENYAE